MTIYASNIYGGSGIPTGDQFRVGTQTALTTSATTILTLTSTAGLISHITVNATTLGTGTTVVSSLKVTVDGAAERTLAGTVATFSNNTSYSSGLQTINFPLPIKFTDSITIKLQANNTTNTTEATVYYTVF